VTGEYVILNKICHSEQSEESSSKVPNNVNVHKHEQSKNLLMNFNLFYSNICYSNVCYLIKSKDKI